MRHLWAVAGEVEPLEIGVEQLLGEVVRIPTINETDFRIAIGAEVFGFRDGLRIRKGVARIHALREPFEGLVLQSSAGVMVGYSFERLARLSPLYRGRGLGAELLAELYVSHPTLMRSRLASRQRLAYTAGGERLVRAAYRLMLERGAVVAPSAQAAVDSAAWATRPSH